MRLRILEARMTENGEVRVPRRLPEAEVLRRLKRRVARLQRLREIDAPEVVVEKECELIDRMVEQWISLRGGIAVPTAVVVTNRVRAEAFTEGWEQCRRLGGAPAGFDLDGHERVRAEARFISGAREDG